MLVIISGIFFILILMFPGTIRFLPAYIEWNTIFILFGLQLLTKALEKSGFFSRMARSLLGRVKTERNVAISIIISSIFLSMILTNDIALFVIIPIIMNLESKVKNDLKLLVIYSVLSVNIGSFLTPFGNPQNIFLWLNWGISITGFILKMFLPEVILSSLLIVFACLVFKNKKIQMESDDENLIIKRKLFIISLGFFIVFIMMMELRIEVFLLVPIIIVFIFLDKKIFREINWVLLLIFMIIFIDVNIFIQIEPIRDLLISFHLDENKGALFVLGVLISQVISNVPTAVLLSRFSSNYKIIAFSTNVGGNGTIIASFANIIGLSFSKHENSLLKFHKHSLVFLLASSILVYLISYFF
ncbi:MAG: SLC13 family permease [Promethearchaeota archaeon]